MSTGTVFNVSLFYPNTERSPEVLAIFKADNINQVYEKLAQIVNNRITSNLQLYQLLIALLNLYNHMCTNVGVEESVINLPISGKYVKLIEEVLKDCVQIFGSNENRRFMVKRALFII